MKTIEKQHTGTATYRMPFAHMDLVRSFANTTGRGVTKELEI